MRDFTDDLRELRRRLGEAAGYLRVDANRDTARRARGRDRVVPTCGTTRSWPRSSTPSTPTSRTTSTTFDQLGQRARRRRGAARDGARDDDESQEAEIAGGHRVDRTTLDQLDLRSLFTGEHDAVGLHRADQREGRRRRRPGLEPRCCCGCTAAGPSGAASSSSSTTISEGAEAGIMSAEFTLTGRYAYGLMTGERGTHRLVRISPFDNQGRRQTSFAAVQVWPVMDDPDVDINEADIRMEVFRASRRRRPAHQQDVVGGASDPRADRPGRQLARRSAASCRTGRRR